MEINDITKKIIGAAIEVHRTLGPGLLESAHEACICFELEKAGLRFHRQLGLPLVYKEIELDRGYRIDILVENAVVVELKVTDSFTQVDEAQMLTYLKLSEKKLGLLLNFNVKQMTQGIKRYILSPV